MKRKLPIMVGGEGNVSTREVHSAIWEHNDEITKCYEAGIKKDKELSGKMTIEVRIGAKGRVISAETTLNELGPVVEKCVLKKIKRIRFPEPEGGLVTVELPMMFVQI